MPICANWAAWSCISAIRGETTTAVVPEIPAGSWYHNDLPPPVGITTQASCAASRLRITFSCLGRNSWYPQWRRKTSARFGRSGILFSDLLGSIAADSHDRLLG